jgi:hypothetical protein
VLVGQAERALARPSTITYKGSSHRRVGHTMRAAFMRIARPKPAPLFQASAGLVVLVLAMSIAPLSAHARVLSDADLDKIASVKKLSIDVMTDITMTSRRPDLSQADSDCVKSTLRSLTQIANELQSYEYLITIESQLKDFDDDNSVRGILRFAVDNALKILDTEHRHLDEVSDQCSRSPISADKARRATQFIESTVSVLKSLQPRL